MDIIQEHNKFWNSFCCDPLYNCGFADFVQGCGANKVETIQEALMAMSYLKGAADACRLANEYMSQHWRIAALIGVAAGTFRVIWEEKSPWNYPDNGAQRFNTLGIQYTRELKKILSEIE